MKDNIEDFGIPSENKFPAEVSDKCFENCVAKDITVSGDFIETPISKNNFYERKGFMETPLDKLAYLNKNNRCNFILRYCKFLDVKNPKISDGLSVGVDLYLPRFDKNFFEAFKKVNDNKDRGRDFILYENEHYSEIQNSKDGSKWIMFDKKSRKLAIFHNCTIPTGIGIDIPSEYYIDLRPRSGCHKDDYTLILGTIDEDYTYGFGFQILLYDKCVSFEEDIRIGQFLLNRATLIDSMNEINIDDWENDSVIKRKRLTRQGGFGHTGKK